MRHSVKRIKVKYKIEMNYNTIDYMNFCCYYIPYIKN